MPSYACIDTDAYLLGRRKERAPAFVQDGSMLKLNAAEIRALRHLISLVKPIVEDPMVRKGR